MNPKLLGIGPVFAVASERIDSSPSPRNTGDVGQRESKKGTIFGKGGLRHDRAQGERTGHQSSKTKIESACNRLRIPTSSSVGEIFDVLVAQLIGSYQTMITVIENFN